MKPNEFMHHAMHCSYHMYTKSNRSDFFLFTRFSLVIPLKTSFIFQKIINHVVRFMILFFFFWENTIFPSTLQSLIDTFCLSRFLHVHMFASQRVCVWVIINRVYKCKRIVTKIISRKSESSSDVQFLLLLFWSTIIHLTVAAK